MKRRIAISAGHSNVKGQDRGAVSNGYIEGELTVELRDLIKEALNNTNVPCSIDPNSNVTFQTVALFRQYFNTGNDICIDIHFNAGGGTGTEVLIPDNFSLVEQELATALAHVISSRLQIFNRGVKQEKYSARKKLFWMTIPAETILIEVAFLDNAKDMSSYNNQKVLLADEIASVLMSYL